MAANPGSISAHPAANALTGGELLPLDQEIGSPVAASALVVNEGYRIVSLGTTNWQACGAGASAAVGTIFKCEAVGTGTGTAQRVDTRRVTAQAIAALAGVAAAITAHKAEEDPHPVYATAQELTTALQAYLTSAAAALAYQPLDSDLTALAAVAGQTAFGRAFLALIDQAGARDYIGIGPDDTLTLTGLTLTGLATLPHIHGGLAGEIYAHVKNTSGGALAIGAPLRITGTVGDTTTLEVVPADAASSATMPALFVLSQPLASNAEGHATMLGEITGVNTSGLTPGAPLFVAVGGGLTGTRPASNAQQVATVGRVHATTGSIHVLPWPMLGTAAAAAVGDFATAAQGTLAGTAVQPSALAEWWTSITSGLGRSLVAAADPAAARGVIGAGTSSVALSDTAPSALAATASAGTASEASRRDHQHALPTAAQIGAASPAGTGSELQYRVAGSPATLGAVSGSSVDGSGNVTLASRLTSTVNGAAGAPAFTLTGSIFTGGTGTSTKPLFLIEPTGTTSTSFNTAGTLFGLNAPPGFTGDIFNCFLNGTSVFSYNATNQRIQLNSGFCGGNFTVNGVLTAQFGLSFNGVTYIGTDDNAANILSIKNPNFALASQTFRVNGTYSFNTSYERLKIAWERSSADCVFIGTITSNILTVTSVISGALAVGQIITGTNLPAGQRITAPGTGTGGPGTYTLAINSTIATSTTFTSGQAVCRIGTEKGSSGGTARAVDLVTDDIARLRIEPDGVIRYSQPAPVAVNSTATLTAANLKTGIITTTTAAAVDMTLPTGTQVDAGFAANIDDLTHEWLVINTGANAATILAATGHTIEGSATVAAGTSALFATRRTATNTYVTYRKS
jgi:hypothetical protein